MPGSVTRMNPEGLYSCLNESGLNVDPLGRGENAGISFWKVVYIMCISVRNMEILINSITLQVCTIMECHIIRFIGIQTGTQRFYLNGDIRND